MYRSHLLLTGEGGRRKEKLSGGRRPEEGIVVVVCGAPVLFFLLLRMSNSLNVNEIDFQTLRTLLPTKLFFLPFGRKCRWARFFFSFK